MEILFVLFLCLGVSYLFSELCQHVLRVPRVVGYIGAGLLLGSEPMRTMILSDATLPILGTLADIGAVLLFFFIGLQLNLGDFNRSKYTSVMVSLLNTLPLIAGGYFIGTALGLSALASAVLGVCLAVSAQSVAVDILEELKLIQTKLGKLIITTGAVDDTLELIIITAILLLINASSAEVGILHLLRNMALFSITVILFRSLFIPFALKAVERDKSQASLFMGSLIIVMLMAGLSAYFGMGSLLGALIAGILVRRTLLIDEKRNYTEEHSISKMVHTIGFGFLIPIFFLWSGITTDLSSIGANLPLLLSITALALVGTVLGTMVGAHLTGRSWREGWLMGWALSPKGDVELVLAGLALKSGIFSLPLYSAVIVMAMLTTIIAPIVFRVLIHERA